MSEAAHRGLDGEHPQRAEYVVLTMNDVTALSTKKGKRGAILAPVEDVLNQFAESGWCLVGTVQTKGQDIGFVLERPIE